MEIRLRTDDDAPALVAILTDVHERDGYPVRRTNVRREWLWDDSFVGAWVATCDGAVVGHVALADGFAGPGVPDGALGISRLFVAPRANGRGAGAALLDAARTAVGDRPLGLEVTDTPTAARALYERLGWRRVGEAEAGWADLDGRHPHLTYFMAP
ncbi:GNAT family N-acetyltransferase [Luteimicrobium album]|uniref:GNAT family N-acetyltransferase n=1 Tax=Luteimicrobium album TaxID=1054550 RepID=A0ABQ6I3L4_9MICO|nr:GNAT family N-acetyltransferase [Luteimicrobium album]GMA25348.1 GNAT family N-acetyltransferase [Luteimicrobium album]